MEYGTPDKVTMENTAIKFGQHTESYSHYQENEIIIIKTNK